MALNGPFFRLGEGALFFVQFVILAKARIQSVALTPTLSLSMERGLLPPLECDGRGRTACPPRRSLLCLRRCRLEKVGNHVAAHQFDAVHNAGVLQPAGLQEAQHLVDTGVLVLLHHFDDGLGVAHGESSRV